MNVVLRKEDGSTSVLLFVYNMLYTKTGETSLRLASLLEIMGAFGKAESAVRMALSRAGKAGLLESSKQGRDVVYSITPQARDCITVWNAGAAGFWKRFAHRQQGWDGKWHSVNLNVDDLSRKAEAAEMMDELGYAQIDGCNFLGPWDRWDEIAESLRQAGIASPTAAVHGELRTNSGVEAFVESTFRLSELRPAYRSFLERYSPVLKQLQASGEQERKLIGANSLPLLHHLGFEFFRVASRDSMLPKDICPDWEGERAALLMRDLRAILDERSWSYLMRFL